MFITSFAPEAPKTEPQLCKTSFVMPISAIGPVIWPLLDEPLKKGAAN